MFASVKRSFAIAMAIFMGLGMLTACGSQPGSTSTTEPEPTDEPAPKQFMKVLTIGHSLSNDATHMLSLVAAAEGYQLTIGSLYYSGCPLYRHVMHLQKDEPAYTLYLSDSSNPNAPDGLKEVTMKQALRHLDWDLIVMQGGTFELAEEKTFTDGNIQIIQNYVNQHKKNPNAVFGWHMHWVFPTDPELMALYPYTPNGYVVGYEKFGGGRKELYEAITRCMEKYILTDSTFRCLIPTGTAMENALSSYLTEKDIHRDYAHATDFGRVMAGYVWYCVLRGMDHIAEIKLDRIPVKYFRSNKGDEDIILTQEDKKLLLEAVNNALKKPLQVTQSQYTVK